MVKSVNSKVGRFVFLYLWVTYIIYLGLMLLRENPGNLEEWRTVIFLSFASNAFYLGCKTVSINNSQIRISKEKKIDNSKILLALIALLVINILYLGDLFTSRMATLSFDIGDNYVERLDAEVSSNSLWGQLNTLTLPLRIILITYCTLYYKQLNKVTRLFFLSFVVILVLGSLFKGMQVGVGNVLIYILVPLFFMMKRDNNLKKFRRFALWGALIFVVFFVLSQLSRATAYDYQLDEKYSDNFLYDIFGRRIGGGLLTFLSYFSHGYRGLNYSLQLPFEWTYGYGGSRALNEYLHQYLHLDSMYNFTYPLRVKAVFGYDCEMSWPTAFAWWASDFSFPGVVILLFFLGKLVCKVIKDSINSYSVISISFLCQLAILVIFMPMNNQAFQARDSLIATVVLFFLWVINRKKVATRNI